MVMKIFIAADSTVNLVGFFFSRLNVASDNLWIFLMGKVLLKVSCLAIALTTCLFRSGPLATRKALEQFANVLSEPVRSKE